MFIRKLQEKDVQSVKKLVTESLAEFGWTPDPKYDFDLENPLSFYSDKLDRFYVLIDKNHVVGTIAIKNHGQGKAELRKFFIAKKYRGLGYGKLLINHLIEYCKKSKFCLIEVLTDPSLVTAIHLYKIIGFRELNINKDGDLILRYNLLR